MNYSSQSIKDIIEYLTQVFNGEEILPKSQKFFLSIPELNKVLNEYYIHFENKDDLKKSVKFNLELLSELSFSNIKAEYIIVKDLTMHNLVNYSLEHHNNYSYKIHSRLINSFENKLGIKEAKENRRITVKSKDVYTLVKKLNLKIDFLKEDCKPEEFINVITGASDKQIYLNINNRSFHYLLTKLKSYFFNFTITSVANTKKIHGLTGNVLNPKNLAASKSHFPKHKEEIDEVFKNF